MKRLAVLNVSTRSMSSCPNGWARVHDVDFQTDFRRTGSTTIEVKFGLLSHIVLDEHMSLRDTHDLGESLQYVLKSVPIVNRAFVHADYANWNLPSHMNQRPKAFDSSSWESRIPAEFERCQIS